MKKMLINATQPEELRVALVENGIMDDFDIERQGNYPTKANIYKGVISKVAPSLDAVFVDLGEEKHGFLPIKEVHSEALLNLKSGEAPPAHASVTSLKHFLREGQEILVQITKPSRGHKGAALTTYVSLAGSYLVLMPNNPRAHGISRRIEGDERQAMKHLVAGLHCPKGMGLIIRTAGVNKDSEDLLWDLESLLNYWQTILKAAADSPAPCLIHQEGNIVSRVVRDYLVRDIQAIIVDEEATFESLKRWIQWFKPEFLSRLQRYEGKIPLFSKEGIEAQIEAAFQREVKLPSGGSISIDRTEALTAIDVNSARSTKCGDIETTAYNTNLEAAVEIARQLRLRDLGGLIVIDFIDMREEAHQVALEERMRSLIKLDRARVQLAAISRFGLMEVSRQRLRPSLEESSSSPCPRCLGTGSLRDSKALALSMLRRLTSIQRLEANEVVCLIVPIHVATFLLNEKREDLESIEALIQHKISVISNPHYLTPQYSILGLSPTHYRRWMDSEWVSLPQATQSHFPFRWIAGLKEEASAPIAESEEGRVERWTHSKQGVVSEMLCATRAQKNHGTKAAKGWWSRLWHWAWGEAEGVSTLPTKALPSENANFVHTLAPRSQALSKKASGWKKGSNNRIKEGLSEETASAMALSVSAQPSSAASTPVMHSAVSGESLSPSNRPRPRREVSASEKRDLEPSADSSEMERESKAVAASAPKAPLKSARRAPKRASNKPKLEGGNRARAPVAEVMPKASEASEAQLPASVELPASQPPSPQPHKGSVTEPPRVKKVYLFGATEAVDSLEADWVFPEIQPLADGLMSHPKVVSSSKAFFQREGSSLRRENQEEPKLQESTEKPVKQEERSKEPLENSGEVA